MNQSAHIHLSLYAMATRFELLMFGDSEIHLRSAGEETLQEIERLDAQLSFYRNDSDITLLNRHAADGFVQVEPRLFTLLKQCVALTALTAGAFDITIAPLMRAWHFVGDTGGRADEKVLQNALETTGIQLLEFDDEAMAVRFLRAGVEVDLGGYGKGYAVQRAIDVLREHGVKSALLHGGTSSVATIGTPPNHNAWRIELPQEFTETGQPECVDLRDECLAVSALHGKAFFAEGKSYGHIINPLTGEPVSDVPAAAVRGTDAAVCEAFTKALLIHSTDWWEKLRERFPDYACYLAAPSEYFSIS